MQLGMILAIKLTHYGPNLRINTLQLSLCLER